MADISYVKMTRAMAEAESHNVPDSAKALVAQIKQGSININQSNINERIKIDNWRALTTYNGVCPILIDGLNLLLTKAAMFMKAHGLNNLEDIKVKDSAGNETQMFYYIKTLNAYTFEMSMAKWLENMLGEFPEYAPKLKHECSRLPNAGNKIIWSREYKTDANGNIELDANGNKVEKITAICAPAIQVFYKGDFDASVTKEAERISLKMKKMNKSISNDELRERATANVLKKSDSLASSKRARNDEQVEPHLPRINVGMVFAKPLFQGIFDKDAKGFYKSVFNVTPHLQLKLMNGIFTILNCNVFGKFMGGFLNRKEYKLNAIMARQILLYILQHDNGDDKVYYDVYDMAKAAFPSFIDSSKGKYISDKDAEIMRWCIVKVCILYSIMLCNGTLDGNLLSPILDNDKIPVYDVQRVWLNKNENIIRLVHSNSGSNYGFTNQQKEELQKMLLSKGISIPAITADGKNLV